MGWPTRLTIVAVGFLLGLFPARNSNLLAHLAAGRDVAHTLHLSSTSSGSDSRVPQTWLADLAFYLTESHLGGPALLVVKALLVALVALLLLRASSDSGARGPLVALLALIALGPYVQLEPVCTSFILFAFTLLWLESTSGLGPGFYRTLRGSWPLLALFALWANLDTWFFLGPAAVFLYALGNAVRRAAGGAPAAGWWVLLLGGVAACFISPLPLHLSDPLPEGLSTATPAQAAFWSRPLPEQVPSLAGLLLALLGAISFALNARAGVWGRLTCWAAFLVGSLVDGRLTPFFAIAAGIAAARNMGELAPREAVETPPRRGGLPARLTRGLAVAFVCGLPLVAAWAGWLQPPPYDRREWRIEPEPSLKRLAEDRARWRPAEAAPGTAFAFSPEVADLLAWFAPDAPVFPTTHPRPDEQADARLVRSAFAGDGSEFPVEEVRQVFRRRKLTRLILFEPSKTRFALAFRRLLSMPAEWPLVYLRGRAAVFAWRDPAAAGAPMPPTVDLDRRAFRPGAEDTAPEAGPPLAGPPGWGDALLWPRPQRSLDRDEATVCLLHQDVTRPVWLDRAARGATTSQAAAFLLAAAGGPLHFAAEGRLRLAGLETLTGRRAGPVGVGVARLALSSFPDAGPGDPLLAVRAARRAIAAQPRDAAAWLVLGETYLRLGQGSWGRRWNASLPKLGRLRQVQAATALYQALTIEPDLAGAHLGLAALFREERNNDLALAHYGRFIRLTRASGPPDPATSDRLRQAESAVEALAPIVEGAQAELAGAPAGMTVLDRAKLAASRGLAGRALDTLLASDIAAFGPGGLFLELDLLLTTGRAREVLLWLTPEHGDILGEADYLWVRAQAEAAAGDYARARATLAELAVDPTPAPREAIAAAVGRLCLAALAPAQSVEKLYFGESVRPRELQRVAAAAAALREHAETSVLRGLIALEQGDTDTARALMKDALAVWGSPAAAQEGAGLDFEGRRVAEDCRSLLAAD